MSWVHKAASHQNANLKSVRSVIFWGLNPVTSAVMASSLAKRSQSVKVRLVLERIVGNVSSRMTSIYVTTVSPVIS